MIRVLFLLATTVSLTLGPTAAQGQEGCGAEINGYDVAEHSSPGEALKISKDDTIDLYVWASEPIHSVQVQTEIGPWRIGTPVDLLSQEEASWQGSVRVADYARFGVGLYHIVVSGDCQSSFWIEVTGRFPLATPVGGGAAGMAAVGLALQAYGVGRGFRRRGGFRWALLGGVPTGLAASVLSQQFALTPLTTEWIAAWTAPSTAMGGLLQVGFSMIGGLRIPWRREGRETAATAPPCATGNDLLTARAEPPPRPGPAGLPAETPEAATAHTLEVERDAPRSAYGLIESPEVVLAATEFEVKVGLSPEPSPGVAGDLLVRPESSVGPWTLRVQVVADGFAIRDDESWRHDLPVTADAAYPTFTLHLTASAQQEQVRARPIQAIYSVDGQTMGLAVRSVAVVRTADLLEQVPVAPADGGAELAIPTSWVSADLTVHIQRGDSGSSGRLLWTFDTPHPGIELPDAALATDIGDDPDQFARHLVDGVRAHEGRLGLHAYLRGVGATIAEEMPAAFWDIFRRTAQLARTEGRQPTVFILSEEPYVPWELALVDPPLDPDQAVPCCLGAEACVGRWVLGHRRPKLPPPSEVQVRSMAVISGVYNQPYWNRLREAEEEAATLERTYGAIPVQANTTEVLRCLGGIPKADLLHFAVHGTYDPNSTTDGLVLIDGSPLDPLLVKGQPLGAAPFVFLNACQVGSGNRVLGDYAGMAEAFLYAGASGVIAPLWSVKDTIAKEIALRFYQEVFLSDTPPADMLRRERAAFRDSSEPASATCLAYLFYGHPTLRLSRLTD